MSNPIDDAKRKIRGLLALAAPNSGATDGERANARALADKLMSKFGLKKSDIPERQVARPQPAPPPVPPVVEEVIIILEETNLHFDFSSMFGSNNSTTSGGFGNW